MTAAIASKLRFLRGFHDGLVLSGSYIYSLINGNQDNGSALQDDIGVMTDHGAPSIDSCPNTIIYRSQTTKFDSEASHHKCDVWLPVKTLQGWKSAIYLGALGGSAVDVNSAFMNFHGTGICPHGSGSGNHAVHVDQLVIYQGSLCADSPGNWNETWGDKGRGLFHMDAYANTFPNHQFYVGFSTAEVA